mmetsp:Transcript_17793/g.60058  ORF Transcript_17793/g.60058 Transcript_17793/m.60058 type:complete len:275 (+) Transcript_17793:3398-4222(+)
MHAHTVDEQGQDAGAPARSQAARGARRAGPQRRKVRSRLRLLPRLGLWRRARRGQGAGRQEALLGRIPRAVPRGALPKGGRRLRLLLRRPSGRARALARVARKVRARRRRRRPGPDVVFPAQRGDGGLEADQAFDGRFGPRRAQRHARRDGGHGQDEHHQQVPGRPGQGHRRPALLQHRHVVLHRLGQTAGRPRAAHRQARGPHVRPARDQEAGVLHRRLEPALQGDVRDAKRRGAADAADAARDHLRPRRPRLPQGNRRRSVRRRHEPDGGVV